MNNKYLSILLALFGEVLLVVGFFLLIPEWMFTNEVRVLDFIVVSIVYGLWMYNLINPLVRLKDPAHRQVAGLGIRWLSLSIYSFVALAVIAGTVIYTCNNDKEGLSFGVQAFTQCVLLFFLLLGLLSARESEQKTAEVFYKEEKQKSGKQDVRQALTKLLYETEEKSDIPAEIKDRIRKTLDEVRYVSPSSSAEALELDRRIIAGCESISLALYDYNMNKTMVSDGLEQLQLNIQRRKKAF